MPTNLYGQGDNYHPLNSHVIPALLSRFHEAKIRDLPFVNIWGTGKVRREFLHVDDLAKACVLIMNTPKKKYQQLTKPMMSHINVGSGEEITINELAVAIAKCVGYMGKIKFDKTKPDGTPRKLLDISKILSLGWRKSINLTNGLDLVYKDFCHNYSSNNQR